MVEFDLHLHRTLYLDEMRVFRRNLGGSVARHHKLSARVDKNESDLILQNPKQPPGACLRTMLISDRFGKSFLREDWRRLVRLQS